MEHQKPVIGITLGDYNGVGPEVILKALASNRILKICTPVIYGSQRVLSYYRKVLDLKDWTLHSIPAIQQINYKVTNVITCWDDKQTDVEPGKVTPEAGAAALACLQKATQDLKDGHIQAIVTAPINKYNIQSEEFKFPGHTEFFTSAFEAKDSLMFLVSEQIRVGVVTGHIPLGRVRSQVTPERISQKLTMMLESLTNDFGIQKPKVAVLGLNPHAGEDGLLGSEEKDVITPVLEQFKQNGNLVFGPFPADGFFGNMQHRHFDAILAMYHDQGLIPFKYIAFENGVNFTAGLPVVRTSPDHGTAYGIAGKNTASESSMLQAIYTAIDVVKNRKESAVEIEEK
ncbi:4-hydroxythreonine-4-phosphate dehydrogenase PdxA [Flectobacillus roseus]|jgi:4-hydroxythreonine-4-phosphate dehydrogenase|nr:4-hydroxythreonine-4-phosphate dehydrogenase PdxA [Emticicia sp. ODNR4P]